jgi:hypothetical protein
MGWALEGLVVVVSSSGEREVLRMGARSGL